MHGGDTNAAYKLTTDTGENFFLKVNSSTYHKGIINSEVDSLQLLASKNLRVPRIVCHKALEHYSFLCLEWIDTTSSSNASALAKLIVNLHSNQQERYGYDKDNYIGNLHQPNRYYSDFTDFYISCRIEPQIRLATEHGYSLSTSFYKNLCANIPEEPPTLIHGDLWGGNYLINTLGAAFLIDPSVSYSHREMDIAMMRLFGGFDSEVFNVYNEMTPLIMGWQNRLDVFQLYYLLIHLNLFGSGYYNQVERIIRKYLRS